MARKDERGNALMRPVSIQAGVNPYAEGSAMCSFGNTKVLCTASVEETVPRFLEGSGKGWITAEYAMLPRSTHTRTGRDHFKAGRASEISRLVGRSLRAAADLTSIDGYTIRIDCDVLVADGGTRTASISGGWVALALAMRGLGAKPLRQVTALSAGRVGGDLMVDLCYEEDSTAELDINLVLTAAGELIEVQGTGEDGVFSPQELVELVELCRTESARIVQAQNAALDGGGR